MCHVLRAGTQTEHRKNLGARVDGQPEKDAPVWRSAASYAVRPVEGERCGGCGRSVLARSARARQPESERLVIVTCR